jgi:hypothetical protein
MESFKADPGDAFLPSCTSRPSWPATAALLLAALFAPSRSEAAAPSAYEDRLVDRELARLGRVRAVAPEGKIVEDISVVRLDVIGADDPWPDFLNAFHRTTLESVVQREVLVAKGGPFLGQVAGETERNLRRLGIFAVVRVVPFEGSAPDRVGLLVLTKDLWSLRLNWGFNAGGGTLQLLEVQLVENNLLGRNKGLGVQTALRLDSLTLAQTYVDERLFGRKLRLAESAALVLNRASGRPEGTLGRVVFERPLYTLRDPWSFSADVAWRAQPARIYRGSQVWMLPYPDAQSPLGEVPFAYRAQELGAAASALRSLGDRFKTELSAGLGAYTHRYRPGADADLSAEQASWLEQNRLPHDEDAVFVSAALRSYQARYAVLRDLRTFALSEDTQLGHDALLRVRAAPALFPSLARFLEVKAAARYRLVLAGDLLSLSAAAAVRFVPGARGTGTSGPFVNRRAAAQVLNATPPLLGIARLVARVSWETSTADLDRRVLLLGGDNGLRGASAGLLEGTQRLLVNIELRTRALELSTVHVGAALFWDAGTTAGRGATVQSVGAGLRILFPQLNTMPIRVDFGYLVSGARPGAFLDGISASFGQFGQITDYEPALLSDLL